VGAVDGADCSKDISLDAGNISSIWLFSSFHNSDGNLTSTTRWEAMVWLLEGPEPIQAVAGIAGRLVMFGYLLFIRLGKTIQSIYYSVLRSV
jgi:hypothetical protein